MADRFERSIVDWYQTSRTADLEFLNLENPNNSDLSNNITVLYDKLLLHSKISIKHFHQTKDLLTQQTERIEERIHRLEQTQATILQSLQILEDEVLIKRPLINNEILAAVNEITQHPKGSEKEILRISTKLEQQQQTLLQLTAELKKTLIG